jgi:hypothetical protein
MNNPSKSCYYFFSAIESGEQIDVKTKEGHEIYLDAEKALKKQVPETVLDIKQDWDIDSDFFASMNGTCPSCGSKLVSYCKQKFCDGCGQALKWGE